VSKVQTVTLKKVILSLNGSFCEIIKSLLKSNLRNKITFGIMRDSRIPKNVTSDSGESEIKKKKKMGLGSGLGILQIITIKSAFVCLCHCCECICST
jgi:hypothetical protein